MTDDLNRKPIEDFIREVPAWRAKYVGGNMCVFKVEAFLQRDWKNPYLDEPSCKENHRRVEELIEKLKRRDDLIQPEDDIEIVYRWGGGRGPGLFRRIVNSNSTDDVRKRMRAAFSALGEECPVEALEQIKSLKGGGDSFGTKVLAMRSPRNAPIWDEIAKASLKEFKIGGKKVKSYEQFIAFCNHVADELKRLGKPAPRGERWYLRDIEMALFQFGWDNDKFKGRITGELS